MSRVASIETLRPRWVEIDIEALAQNVRTICNRIGSQVQFYAVCKNDGFGCGAAEAAVACIANGADALAVTDPQDAWKIREAGVIAPVLLFPSTLPVAAEVVANLGVTPTLHDKPGLEAFAALRRSLNVFVKVDCGFGRFGFTRKQWREAFALLHECTYLRVTGLYCHMDTPEDRDAIARQTKLCTEAVTDAGAAGLIPRTLMVASSRVVIGFPELDYSAVNPGRMLFGLLDAPWDRYMEIRPVIRAIKSQIIQIKDIEAGSGVGYGRVAQQKLRTGIIPLGFADGLPREPDRRLALVKGRRAPLIGMRSTEATTLDITDLPDIRLGDEVVLMGQQGDQEISAATFSGHFNTPILELLPRLARSLPRTYRN
ncbi:alanine racemase [soil metagenome]